ncbi:HAD-like domain-containing protein [Morchella snyderi]|nr:HAD-like domain-containing protein [Morchella snyderi]
MSHANCSPASSSRGVIATLFRKKLTSSDSESSEDSTYGARVSDMSVFEFMALIDAMRVPWRKESSNHKCLHTTTASDNTPAPMVMEIAFCMPEILKLDELRRHTDFWQFEKKWNIEIAFQENDVFRRHKRLAVFDMDSTLIQQEVIDEIARFIGVEDQVSAITARAMNGEIDFTESLRQRVALLKGVPSDVFEKLKSVITFTPGARELTRALKTLGFKLAVLSGGFMPLANYVKEELDLDYAHANTLVISEDGTQLTGELTGDIVHAERKAELLEKIANENGIALRQVIAIGDGANDLPMMFKAGLGIAFDAKPAVQLRAPCRINSGNLQDVLYILGFTKEEQDQILGA